MTRYWLILAVVLVVCMGCGYRDVVALPKEVPDELFMDGVTEIVQGENFIRARGYVVEYDRSRDLDVVVFRDGVQLVGKGLFEANPLVNPRAKRCVVTVRKVDVLDLGSFWQFGAIMDWQPGMNFTDEFVIGQNRMLPRTCPSLEATQ